MAITVAVAEFPSAARLVNVAGDPSRLDDLRRRVVERWPSIGPMIVWPNIVGAVLDTATGTNHLVLVERGARRGQIRESRRVGAA